MGLDLFSNLQKSSLQVNGPLLKLKFTYFFVYASTLKRSNKFEKLLTISILTHPYSMVYRISVRLAYFHTNYRLHATSHYIWLRTSYVNTWTCHHRLFLYFLSHYDYRIFTSEH